MGEKARIRRLERWRHEDVWLRGANSPILVKVTTWGIETTRTVTGPIMHLHRPEWLQLIVRLQTPTQRLGAVTVVALLLGDQFSFDIFVDLDFTGSAADSNAVSGPRTPASRFLQLWTIVWSYTILQVVRQG